MKQVQYTKTLTTTLAQNVLPDGSVIKSAVNVAAIVAVGVQDVALVHVQQNRAQVFVQPPRGLHCSDSTSEKLKSEIYSVPGAETVMSGMLVGVTKPLSFENQHWLAVGGQASGSAKIEKLHSKRPWFAELLRIILDGT